MKYHRDVANHLIINPQNYMGEHVDKVSETKRINGLVVLTREQSAMNHAQLLYDKRSSII